MVTGRLPPIILLAVSPQDGRGFAGRRNVRRALDGNVALQSEILCLHTDICRCSSWRTLDGHGSNPGGGKVCFQTNRKKAGGRATRGSRDSKPEPY